MLIPCFRNPDDPFTEVIPETPEISMNPDSDLFKDSSAKATPAPNSSQQKPLSPVQVNTNNMNNFSVSSSRPTLAKTSKFGAVKVVKSVNFDEIEAKARAEREEADKRGLASQMSTSNLSSPTLPAKSPIMSKSSATTTPPSSIMSPKMAGSNTGSHAPAPPIVSKEQQDAMDRLGMGMRKMNINQSVSSSHAVSSAAASAKCKQQQAISSEQFSSRDNSRADDSFVNDRLREIDTSKGISSDAFFGRANSCSPGGEGCDDDDFGDGYSASSQNYQQHRRSAYQKSTSPTNSSYSNLSNSAKDLASKLAEKASTIDIKGMKKSISSAGSRLSAYLQDLQNNKS